MRITQATCGRSWLTAIAVLLATAAPAAAADIARQLTVSWVPATAYGLALIAAYTSTPKK